MLMTPKTPPLWEGTLIGELLMLARRGGLAVAASRVGVGSVWSFLVSAAPGAAIWRTSPALTGQSEPWDSYSPYYWLALLGSGVVVGLVSTRPLVPATAGFWAGQMGYLLLFLPLGPLVVLGAVFLFGYSLAASGTACVIDALKQRLWRAWRERGPRGA
jgi:hypothetical protein